MNRRQVITLGAGSLVAAIPGSRSLLSQVKSTPALRPAPPPINGSIVAATRAATKPVTALAVGGQVTSAVLNQYSSAWVAQYAAMTQAGWFSATDAYLQSNPTSLSNFSLSTAQAQSLAASLPFSTPLSGASLNNFVEAVANPANGQAAYNAFTTYGSDGIVTSMVNTLYSDAADTVGGMPTGGHPIRCNENGCTGPTYNCSDGNWMVASGAWLAIFDPALGGIIAAVGATMVALLC